MQKDKLLINPGISGFSDKEKTLHNLELLNQTPFKENTEELLSLILTSPSPDDGLNNMERIASMLSTEAINSFIKDKETLKRLVAICGSSNLLSNTIVNNPVFIEQLLLERGIEKRKDRAIFLNELDDWIENLSDLKSVARALRLFKQREYLRIGARDILGLSSMEDTTLELSELASASLEAAYIFGLKHLKKDYGTPVYADMDGSEKESEFVVMGMGKLGGMELNFSSDIDIIYLYSSDMGETTGISKGGQITGRISLHAFYVKLSEMITKLIGGVTEDGIVFRVDLNLRPEGKNGDICNSLRSAEIYYESWGQTWERAAMIKARPVAGSMHIGEYFLKMIEPFVHRRYLDFTAIEEIRGMKERIDVSLLRANPDAVDVKLGVGGIREIEFFVQAIQLINGGKDKGLREKNTLRAIEALRMKGHINPLDAGTLKDAYIFLRNLEHRIQIVEGRQTQVIPAGAAQIERLARMVGLKNREGFWNEYKKWAGAVHEIYSTLFYKSSKELEEGISKDVILLLSEGMDKEDVIERLSKSGFRKPEKAYENLNLLKEGAPLAHFLIRAKVLLKKIAPFLLSRIMESPDPDMALAHLERFLSAIGAKTTFYSLLAENRNVMELLIRLFGTSVFLSMALIEHPENLDTLLSPELARPFKNKEDFLKELSSMVSAAADYEDMLACIRRFRNGEILRIGINDILGELEARAVSKQIVYLAEASLIKAYEIALSELEKRFGSPGEDARFAVIGLGKLGGEELIYGSDLDIIFVYSKSGDTSGPKVISNHEFFAKLSQRIISILSIVTREGFAFKVDTRLRPSGSSGPLVTSEEAFIKYHRETSQMWERQAMLKARFVAGDAEFASRTLNSLQECIYASPLKSDDMKELYKIRKRMEMEIAKEGNGRYNIKFGKGGLVDVEFTTQLLQLKFGREKISIRQTNTLDAIDALKNAAIIEESDFQVLSSAYTYYRLLENRLRIVHNRAEGEIVKDSPELIGLAKRTGYSGDDADKKLIEDYLNHAARVRDLYDRIIGIKEI